MPGIAGIISHEPPAACRRRLAEMIRSMRHEACYESATCEAPEIGVYAGWVADPGSFANMESGSGASGAIDLAFAGECFHDSSGSSGPADVAGPQRGRRKSVLELYDRFGQNWVVRLNGLFSGLLI